MSAFSSVFKGYQFLNHENIAISFKRYISNHNLKLQINSMLRTVSTTGVTNSLVVFKCLSIFAISETLKFSAFKIYCNLTMKTISLVTRVTPYSRLVGWL